MKDRTFRQAGRFARTVESFRDAEARNRASPEKLHRFRALQEFGKKMEDRVGLMVDRFQRGSWNMAMDRALLEQALNTGALAMRLYEWEPATVSLGYFQSHRDRAAHSASLHCPWVRRATGGGAIVHDRELTYSMVFPQQSRWALEHGDLYRRVHQTLIQLLEELKVPGCRFCDEADEPDEASPFLCFERRSPGDVLLGEHKIIGSAQRRLNRALLQHGSILVERSPAAPELPGINDLAGGRSNLQIEELVARWPQQLEAEFGWKVEICNADRPLLERAAEIEREIFMSSSWNEKR